MNTQAQFPLPDDILIVITTQLKRTSSKNGDLFSLLLVSKQWYQITVPILYGNVALTDTTIGKFGRCLNAPRYSFHLRSLTLHIEAKEHTTSSYGQVLDFDSHRGTLLEEKIVGVSTLIPGMQRLSSFSLNLEREKFRMVRRVVIIDLIGRLPDSVTSLEIDTRGQDQCDPHQQIHICDALRAVLPRMQHIRIRLASMCCALFGTRTREPQPSPRWEPTKLPNLKSLVVSCSLPNGQLARRCGRSAWRSEMVYPNQVSEDNLAWGSVTFGLAELVATQSTIPNDAQVCATIVTKDGYNHWRMPTSFCVDMGKKESLGVPFMSLGYGAPSEVSWLVRFPNDVELIAESLHEIESLIEAGRWKDVVGALRLPAPIVEAERLGRPSWATGCEEIMVSVEDSNVWRSRNPTKMSMLWRDEEQLNMKLLGAVKRVGETQYMDTRPIKEELPEGWTRLGNGQMLVRH